MAIEERANEYQISIDNEHGCAPTPNYCRGCLDGYVKGATEERDIILDAYCKTCCNLDRTACLASGGECKQYARLIKNIEEV